MKANPSEYADYYGRYVSLVPDADIVQTLASQLAPLRSALASLPEDRAGFRYAPGKWTVRESLGHVIDTERVFGHRAFWFARGGAEPLPGFDQEPFEAAGRHDRNPIAQLIEEFCAVRESHLLMFRHFDEAAWSRVGTASGNAMSVRGAASIMAGHLFYHAALLRDRYDIPIDMAKQ